MTTNVSSNRLTMIDTVAELHYYLKEAMKLEHATIPPYITALYSLKPGKNLEAFHILRAIAVEEMLHLTLAANVLNAVGGTITSTLTGPDFVPKYPSYLPNGETDFKVSVEKFSPEAVESFLEIERPAEVPEEKPLVVSRAQQNYMLSLHNHDQSYSFYSIGQFYSEIIRGLFALHREMGEDLFCGDPKRQITPEYYFDGGGEIIPVRDINSAIRALTVIKDQGEGSRVGQIYDAEGELAHYYRFQQLKLGRYYVVDKDNPEKSDKPDYPTGGKFTVDWDAVYPVKTNASLTDYPDGSELSTAAKDFQSAYSKFLADIEYAFDGYPQYLIPAVGGMFRLKDRINSLIRNPIPTMDGVNAAPIFRLD